MTALVRLAQSGDLEAIAALCAEHAAYEKADVDMTNIAGRLRIFLFGDIPSRMVQFTRRSPRFAAIMQDLFAGRQPYLGLKKRLLENLNPSLYEIAMSFGFSRIVPKARSV